MDEQYQSNTYPDAARSGKGKLWLIILAVVVVSLAAAGGVYYWQQSVAKKQKAELRSQIDALKKQVADTEKKVKDAEVVKENSLDDITWVKKSYGSVWNIEYPSGWSDNGGANPHGFLMMSGEYGGERYTVNYIYPKTDAEDLASWVESSFTHQSDTTKSESESVAMNIKGASAVKVYNFKKNTDSLFIWRTDSVTVRQVELVQVPGKDAATRKALFDAIISHIN